jgi:general L-amino acid transport system substrate-binding protein
MDGLRRSVWALAACAALVLSCVPAGAQTLAQVRARGALVCGVNGELPGFSMADPQGRWSGFDVDFCRAVAAAALGDATRVRFVPLTAVRRFDALRSAEVDLLARNTTVTLDRAAGSGVRYAAVTYIDGQRLVVAKRLHVSEVEQLDGKTVCVTRATTHERNLQTWFAVRARTVRPVVFEKIESMLEAYFAGRCSAVTQDGAALALAVISSGRAAEHVMLPDLISREPLGPFVRSGDDAWLDIVRWTHNVMVEAEEQGFRRATIDQERASGDAMNDTTLGRRLFGTAPDGGKALGLDDGWAYRIVRQVGNYGEVFDRNLGAGSPLKFARGINGLISRGGVLYALPM